MMTKALPIPVVTPFFVQEGILPARFYLLFRAEGPISPFYIRPFVPAAAVLRSRAKSM